MKIIRRRTRTNVRSTTNTQRDGQFYTVRKRELCRQTAEAIGINRRGVHTGKDTSYFILIDTKCCKKVENQAKQDPQGSKKNA